MSYLPEKTSDKVVIIILIAALLFAACLLIAGYGPLSTASTEGQFNFNQILRILAGLGFVAGILAKQRFAWLGFYAFSVALLSVLVIASIMSFVVGGASPMEILGETTTVATFIAALFVLGLLLMPASREHFGIDSGSIKRVTMFSVVIASIGVVQAYKNGVL